MLLPTLAHVTTLAETAKHSPLTGEARRPELGGHAAGLKVVVVGISVAVVMSQSQSLCAKVQECFGWYFWLRTWNSILRKLETHGPRKYASGDCNKASPVTSRLERTNGEKTCFQIAPGSDFPRMPQTALLSSKGYACHAPSPAKNGLGESQDRGGDRFVRIGTTVQLKQ